MVAAACLLIATAVLGLEPFTRVNDVAAVLAGLIIVAVAVRMVLVSVQEAKLLRQLADNEAQFRRLIETAAEGIVITDTEGRCILANERFADLTGYSPEDWIGRPVPEAVRPEHRELVATEVAATVAGERTTNELSGERPDGTEWRVMVSATSMNDSDGNPTGTIALLTDITARYEAEQQLRESEKRFSTALRDAPVGMTLVAVDGGEISRYLSVNAAALRISGYTEEAMLGTAPGSLSHPDDAGVESEFLAELLAGNRDKYEIEKRIINASGETVPVALTCSLVRDDHGQPLYLIRQIQDISERRRFEHELEHLATHDPLTGLLNRRRLGEELERQIAYSKRYSDPHAVLMLDLDGFKGINDTYGHDAGDATLVNLTKAVQARLRRTDTFARIGGDEFIIVLPRTTAELAEQVAGDLLRAVRETDLSVDGTVVHLTASIGIVEIAGGETETPDLLLDQADTAMYEAKESGRDRFVLKQKTGAS